MSFITFAFGITSWHLKCYHSKILRNSHISYFLFGGEAIINYRRPFSSFLLHVSPFSRIKVNWSRPAIKVWNHWSFSSTNKIRKQSFKMNFENFFCSVLKEWKIPGEMIPLKTHWQVSYLEALRGFRDWQIYWQHSRTLKKGREHYRGWND